jgi:hypothetical protein
LAIILSTSFLTESRSFRSLWKNSNLFTYVTLNAILHECRNTDISSFFVLFPIISLNVKHRPCRKYPVAALWREKIHNCPDCCFISYYTFASYIDLPDKKILCVLICNIYCNDLPALNLRRARQFWNIKDVLILFFVISDMLLGWQEQSEMSLVAILWLSKLTCAWPIHWQYNLDLV